jgi:hypothetical protein
MSEIQNEKEQAAVGPVINLRDKVEVVSTEKDPYHITGETFKVHPEVAKKLIANGLAKAKK